MADFRSTMREIVDLQKGVKEPEKELCGFPNPALEMELELR